MKYSLTLLLTIILSVSSVAQSPDTIQLQPLVITHATVLDMTSAAPKPDMTVVIISDKITTVGKSSNVSVPKNAQVVDATGKFNPRVMGYARSYLQQLRSGTA